MVLVSNIINTPTSLNKYKAREWQYQVKIYNICSYRGLDFRLERKRYFHFRNCRVMIISISAKEEIYITLISVNREFRDWFDEATCYCARLQQQS